LCKKHRQKKTKTFGCSLQISTSQNCNVSHHSAEQTMMIVESHFSLFDVI
jgi:hypothetical protein